MSRRGAESAEKNLMLPAKRNKDALNSLSNIFIRISLRSLRLCG